MPNSFFQFKQFRIEQAKAGMKVTTDGCFFGASIVPYENARILDIGSGTGLLSLMLAQRTETSTFEAIEIDENTFLQTQENFLNSPWSQRLSVTHTSLQEFVTDVQFDQIICNPPFFKDNFKGDSSQKNKAIHNDFLPFRELAKNASLLLSPKGEFWVMLPQYEMRLFIEEAAKWNLNPYSHIVLRNQKDGPVFRDIVEFCLEKRDHRMEQDTYIKNNDGKYSDGFIASLKDFYLHL